MLPYDNMDFVPFDVLTAEELDQMVANIESLSDGSGILDGAVTPDKRSGGFYIGSISSATLGSNGNKSITGVGFRPNLVRFTLRFASSTSAASGGTGAMTASSQFATAFSGVGSNAARDSSTSSCIMLVQSSNTVASLASFVSMDDDGFTINVTTSSQPTDVSFEAYG